MAREKQTGILVVDVATDTLKFSTAGRMANAMTKIKEKTGRCRQQDLNQAGFTEQEVTDHWDAAHFLIAINNLGTWGE